VESTGVISIVYSLVFCLLQLLNALAKSGFSISSFFHSNDGTASLLSGLGFINGISTLLGIFIASPITIASPVRREGRESASPLELSGIEERIIDWSSELDNLKVIKVPH